MLRTVCLIGIVPIAGCSLVYDFDSLEAQDARVVPDVDPSALELERLEPAELFEGTGCVPGDPGQCAEGSRPTPVVILGSDIAQDAQVTLEGAGFSGEVAAEVSVFADMAAFAISVPVDTELGAEGQPATSEVTVTVSQAGISRELALTIRGLPELALDGDDPAAALDADDEIEPLYSRIELGGGPDTAIEISGDPDHPARLVATAEIVLDTRLVGNGRAGNVSGRAGGPGACPGGGPATQGECPEGGGGAGMSGGGGGGGGHDGMGSGGQDGASGGGAVGADTLARIAGSGAEVARGHGGGGGSGLTNGGGGGGGGGVIELTSGGLLSIGEAGAIEARGGSGAPPSTCLATSSSGGGGSGGAVLIRAGLAATDGGEGDRVAVDGGPSLEAGGCKRGGRGADGRVRIDVPTSAALPLLAVPTYQGPVLAPDLPAVTRDASFPAGFVGAPNQRYFFEVEGAAREPASTVGDRTGEVLLELSEGLNRVCAAVDSEISLSVSEGVNCRDVAYIPQ